MHSQSGILERVYLINTIRRALNIHTSKFIHLEIPQTPRRRFYRERRPHDHYYGDHATSAVQESTEDRQLAVGQHQEFGRAVSICTW